MNLVSVTMGIVISLLVFVSGVESLAGAIHAYRIVELENNVRELKVGLANYIQSLCLLNTPNAGYTCGTPSWTGLTTVYRSLPQGFLLGSSPTLGETSTSITGTLTIDSSADCQAVANSVSETTCSGNILTVAVPILPVFTKLGIWGMLDSGNFVYP